MAVSTDNMMQHEDGSVLFNEAEHSPKSIPPKGAYQNRAGVDVLDDFIEFNSTVPVQ